MNRTTLILAATVLALVMLIILFGPAACQKLRNAGLQHDTDQHQIVATQNSAVDAVQTQGGVNTNQAASEDLTRTNAEEIRNAKGSDAHIDPAAQLAGLRALCRRPSYRDSERCRLLVAH